ncbi:MAG: tetratricopeptide repeat protein [Mediterranea sp.]|nr:tetratricopeptide repeat protein [Mediterranea sp.]
MKTINSDITDQYQYITMMLDDMRLKDALPEIKEFLVKTNDWNLQDKIEEIETSYNYMLEYMRQDVDDPKRTEMHLKLLRDTFKVLDTGYLLRISSGSYRSLYLNTLDKLKRSEIQYTLDALLIELESYTENYAVTSLLQTEDSDEKLDAVRQHHEEIQKIMFNRVWTTQSWTNDEAATAKKMIESVLIHENDLCLFVSAVTLSLLEFFDQRKLMLLFDAYRHENNQISQRALVGLAIMFQLYHARIAFYPEVTGRLALLNENERFGKSLNRIQIEMLRSKDTEKINKKMQEEIIPEMIKSANPQNLRINPDELSEEDHNPDWTYNIENSSLGDKLREMSELQMEGADIYMSTFTHQKGYPFFRNINNWFYRFDKQHSSIAKELSNDTDSNVIDLILDSAFFCDSDKYSLLFTILTIPMNYRDMMIKQLSSQSMDELTDKEQTDAMKKITNDPKYISNQYIHDLYRFFKVFPYRNDFTDIFKAPLLLHEYPVLKEIIYKPQLFNELVDFNFHKEHYNEAVSIYNILIELGEDDAELYQKLGYCHQKLKDLDKALDAYQKADMLKPDNVWTNYHIATCYRIMTDYHKALSYYKKVEEVQPENRSLLYNIGSCLVELKQFDEAIQYFFKLDFIDPDNTRTWRAIAWCSFMIRKNEQAMKFYDRIIGKDGVAPDYLNAGHVAWCLGDIKKAIERYTRSCELSGSKTLFLDIFNKDKEYLMKNGINEYDIALMYDLI